MVGHYNFSDVFISYSRKDSDFVHRLDAAFKAHNREVWVDFEDIPLTADWLNEIFAGIEAANTFLAVISPDYVRSSIVEREVEHAFTQGKRIVPIVYRDLVTDEDKERVHPALATHNWLFFRESDDFDETFAALLKSLDTDLDYVSLHTELLVKANEWESKGFDDSFLLYGTPLREAQAWLANSAGKQPPPTEQHRNYIAASERFVARRRRRMTAFAIYGVVVLFLALFALFEARLASRRATEANNALLTVTAEADIIATQRQNDRDLRMTINAEIATVTAEHIIIATESAIHDALVATLDAVGIDAQSVPTTIPFDATPLPFDDLNPTPTP